MLVVPPDDFADFFREHAKHRFAIGKMRIQSAELYGENTGHADSQTESDLLQRRCAEKIQVELSGESEIGRRENDEQRERERRASAMFMGDAICRFSFFFQDSITRSLDSGLWTFELQPTALMRRYDVGFPWRRIGSRYPGYFGCRRFRFFRCWLFGLINQRSFLLQQQNDFFYEGTQ